MLAANGPNKYAFGRRSLKHEYIETMKMLFHILECKKFKKNKLQSII